MLWVSATAPASQGMMGQGTGQARPRSARGKASVEVALCKAKLSTPGPVDTSWRGLQSPFSLTMSSSKTFKILIGKRDQVLRINYNLSVQMFKRSNSNSIVLEVLEVRTNFSPTSYPEAKHRHQRPPRLMALPLCPMWRLECLRRTSR